MSYFGVPRPRSSLSRRQEFTLTILVTLSLVAVGAQVVWSQRRGVSAVIESIRPIHTPLGAEQPDAAPPTLEDHK